MSLWGIILAFTIWIPLESKATCIELEGINIGCVSSVDHSCKKNVAVDNKNAPCNFVGSPNVMYRVEAPISWRCKSSRNVEVCTDKPGNNDQSGRDCRTHSECIEYFPPTCQETCVPCFDVVVTENSGEQKGCIVCTRKKCPDEPDAQTVCPAFSSQGLPRGPGNKCSSSQSCPTTAIPPTGGPAMDVIVNRGNCQPPKLPEPQGLPSPQACPWKIDNRSVDGCEPIEESNRNG